MISPVVHTVILKSSVQEISIINRSVLHLCNCKLIATNKITNYNALYCTNSCKLLISPLKSRSHWLWYNF